MKTFPGEIKVMLLNKGCLTLVIVSQ